MRIFNFTQIGIIKQRTGPRGAAAIKQISPSLISGVQTLVISPWMPGVIQPQQMNNLQHSKCSGSSETRECLPETILFPIWKWLQNYAHIGNIASCLHTHA